MTLSLILLQATLTIAVSGSPASPEYLSLHVAQAEGDFGREGLSAAFSITQGEAGAAEALAQGKALVAATSLEERLGALARARLKGLTRLLTAPAEELAGRLPVRVVGLPDEFRLRLAAARGVLLPRGCITADAFQASVELQRLRSPLPRNVHLPRNLADLLSLDPLGAALGNKPKR